MLHDCSGEAQCVTASKELKALQLKLEDTVEIYGRVRAETRSKWGYEVDILHTKVLNRAATPLPFQDGVEVTTGGQRLHHREDLENALRKRGMGPHSFESLLRMFELGMPPHGGLAIGLERLTAQVLGLQNIREAVLYPRDRNRVTP